MIDLSEAVVQANIEAISTQDSTPAEAPATSEISPSAALEHNVTAPDEVDANPMHAKPVTAEAVTTPDDHVPISQAVPVIAPESTELSAPDTRMPETSSPTASAVALTNAAESATPTANAESYQIPEGEAQSAARKLTLEEIIALAIKNSPEREIADAQIAQAEFAVSETDAALYPQATIKTEAGYEYNDPFAVRQGATQFAADNFANNTTGNLRQLLYDGFVTRQSIRQRMQQVESSRISKAKVTEELIKATTEVYMEVYQFQQVVTAGRENLEALNGIADLVALRVEAGDASKAEQNYVLARVAAARQNLVNAEAGLRDAYAALAYLIGDVGPIEAQNPDLGQYATPDAEEIVEQAISNSTEMRLISSDQAAAIHELKAAKGRFSPEVAVVLDGNHAEDVGGQSGIRNYGSAKLQLTYRILDGDQRRATVQKQTAKLKEFEGRVSRARREITQRVSRDINRQQSTLKELEITEQEIAANTELEDLYRKQFKEGEIDITNLVESQERIFSARAKKFKLESDRVNLTFSLLRSMAELLPKFCQNGAGC